LTLGQVSAFVLQVIELEFDSDCSLAQWVTVVVDLNLEQYLDGHGILMA
jgi:hypothetical protein